jgi:endonuclease/exonuclease/phosphatase family metal-dependent hydrolase
MRLFPIIILAWLLLLSQASQASEPGHAPTLRLMTYNIRAADFGLRGIIKTLRQTKADIIALQEVDRRVRRTGRVDQPQRFSRALAYHGVFRRHFRYQGGDYGLMLLSRYRIDRVQRLSVKYSNLKILQARVHTPGRPLTVFVVHFHPTNPLGDQKKRNINDRARMREARRVLASAIKIKGPVVIMGDFNDDTGSPPYRLMADHFQDACDKAGGWWDKTWPATFPVTRIDYIWVSPKIRIKRCRTLSSEASDHRPVVADVALPTRP